LKRRLFLTCWIVFSLHFATNVVREHYPAFSLIENGDFKLDEYAGFHSDIFEHRDGHHYIGNQVTASVIAAIPLLLFDPILDWLEEVGKRRVAARDGPAGEYETEYPNRREFFRKVQERGLDLRFGAATVVTSVFLMAPLTALFAVLMLDALLRRNVPEIRALWLAILFALGTPIAYRAAVLNHNMFLAMAIFGSFLLLWPQSLRAVPLSAHRRFWAGFLAGLDVALDYAGVVPLFCLFGYLLLTHGRGREIGAAFRSAPAFILGSIPPLLFLLWSQWISYGNPFLPGQLWMPEQNIYVSVGARGFTLPDPEIFLLNLIDLDWGMYTFGPLLILGLLPARFARREALILPRRERRFVSVLVLAFMLFCASNQYSRLQWNTGFRYLLPLVPFIFLALSDHLVGMRTSRLALISVPVLLHSWVLSMVRYAPGLRGQPEAIPENWCRFLAEGVQFRWLNVIKSTPSLDIALLRSPVFPYLLLAITTAAIFLIWRLPQGGARAPAPPHGRRWPSA
jgi:hypothetical protein